MKKNKLMKRQVSVPSLRQLYQTKQSMREMFHCNVKAIELAQTQIPHATNTVYFWSEGLYKPILFAVCFKLVIILYLYVRA